MIRFAVAFVCICLVGIARAEDLNRVVNPSFESTGDWIFSAQNGCRASGDFDDTEHHTGKRSFHITSSSKFAPNVYGRLYQMAKELQPFTTYRITAWAKGKNVGIAWVGGGPGWYLRKRFPEGTFDWTQVSVDYTTADVPPDFELMVAVESEVGNLWVDDITMVPTSHDEAKQKQVLEKLHSALSPQKQRLEKLEQRAKDDKAVAGDPYIALGIATARRFVDRIEKPGEKTRQSMAWSLVQAEEIGTVLDEIEKLLKAPRVEPIPRPGDRRAAIKDGIFVTMPKDGAHARPFFFDGYGHFDAVERDLPNFPALGATLIQDGRVGPSSMNPDGTLTDKARVIFETLDRAAANNMRVDYLLSPHYFPEWALKKAPDIANGNIGFLGINIDHPLVRDTIEKFAAAMAREMKDKPALFSICLSNEPVYAKSGHDKYSRPMFIEYLKTVHGGNIAALNELYGTSYKSFDEVKLPGMGLPKEENARRAYYDWTRFNNQHFADWHAWMRDVLKKQLPNVPVHSKMMVFQTFDRDKLFYGIDPELMVGATDIAGCDAYAFMDNPTYAYSWHGHEFFYDLMHSFGDQPVFNSENHVIPDGAGPGHIPIEHTRAAMWQGALHHQGATTIWVWEEPLEGSLSGSIYLRPNNVYGAGRAFLDLNRCSDEVAAIDRAKPRVAMLYSPTSIFWSDQYQNTIYSTYTQLTFLGENVTFVSERQLARGAAPDVQAIIVPQATHVMLDTVKGLSRFENDGGKVIAIGNGNLERDEYNRPRTLPSKFEMLKLESKKTEAESAAAVHDLLAGAGLKLVDLTDADGKPPWGVEYRVVDHAGGKLMPLINMMKAAQTVTLPKEFAGATDLLSGETVEERVKLEPMVPHLLRGRTP